MIYIFLIITILLVVIFLFKNFSKKIEQKKLEKIRKWWGFPKKEYFNFNKIESFTQLKLEQNSYILTEQTKTDIDFYDIFSYIDRTTSKVGQQYLFNKLSNPSNDISKLQELNKQVNFFKKNTKEREATQLLLCKLNKDDAYFISSLLLSKLFERPKWFYLLVIDIVVTLLLLLFTPRFHFLVIGLMFPLAINIALHFWNKKNTVRFIKSFPQLNLLISTTRKLSSRNLPFDSKDAIVSTNNLKSFQSKYRRLHWGEFGGADDLSQIFLFLLVIIKAFFLIELFTFFSLIEELENKQKDILNIFKYVGSIDTAISIASVRTDDKIICQPQFKEAPKNLESNKLYHPLIENCVTNDIKINGKSILITGSNMSGKSTFLRSVAINSLLAHTIFTCFAESFVTPLLQLSSSIRIDDNLLEGKSFYFEEVNVISSLIQNSDSKFQNIFILDEVFKGTNTVERIASAKAILSYLNKGNNIVLVATHDIELSELLINEYDLYHFEETIINNQLYFDHKLKSGQLKTRNAIKILEISGYPSQIIQEARAMSETIISKK